ncbi:MAG TPA: NADH-quinone oxidoreductase subunit M [Myxococcales bacterium]|nr:NADH-quinone oxidoreductase subunit M [Myxococcales bacterium]
MSSFPWLSLLIFLPAMGAIAVACLPAEEHGQQRALGTLFMLLTLAAAIGVAVQFDAAAGAPEFQLQERAAWVPALGISYHVGIDGIALVLILLTAVLGPLVMVSAFRAVTSRVKEFVIALLLLQTAMLGAFSALDLFLFYVFWEAMLVPMYLLIGIWGSERRIYATVKFFIYTMAGSLLMLVAILYLYSVSGAPAIRTFDYPELLSAAPLLPHAVQRWLFLAFAISFAIKVPLVPLHTWLPDAHTEAPAAGSVVLAGVLLKMGGFGFLRYAFPLFPDGAMDFRWALAVIAVVGIVYGALMCLAQSDMKRLVAYSSVSHLGFVMLGLTALTAEGLSGGVYQMLNHGVSTGALFVLVGMLYERRHTRALGDYGGLAKVVPALAALWLLVTLASIGLPGTNGFVGEFLILAGAWNSRLQAAPWLTAAAALGVILGAVYMLWMYQRVFFGKVEKPANEAIADLSGREWAVLAPLAALIVLMGIFPQPLLDRIQPAAERLVARMQPHHEALVGTPPPSLIAMRPILRPHPGLPPPGVSPYPGRNLPALPPQLLRQLQQMRQRR